MHTTTKDVIGTADDAKSKGVPVGTHILTSVIEGDGAVAMASEKASLSAKVLHVTRTDSGGIEVQTAVYVSEPGPAPVVASAPVEDPNFLKAVDYFIGKGLTNGDARKQVNRFGVTRVLNAMETELNVQLQAMVSKQPE